MGKKLKKENKKLNIKNIKDIKNIKINLPKIKFFDDFLVKIKEKTKDIYISFNMRIVICAVLFLALMGLSFLFLTKTLNVSEQKVITYQDVGALDYKVYLKENEFYEAPYLDKNMVYIASLIKNINVSVNYRFLIDNVSDMDFSYDIVGNLVISTDQGAKKLYQKEYILKSSKVTAKKNMTVYNITDNFNIDYDYYNSLANKFKSTFGVDASAHLEVYVKIKKKVTNELHELNLNETKQLQLTIPLSQKTLNISINDTGINSTNNKVDESKISVGNVVFAILCLVSFVGAVAAILKTLEMIFVLIPKTSKYEKYVKKILNEYDRLIVETPTELRLENKEVIVIKRFEELLDARDNLKRPIMYHKLNSQKCSFYIEKENTVYLLTVKAVDLEEKKEVKKK